MGKRVGKRKITVYNVHGEVFEVINRTIYSFNRGRRSCYGQYIGLHYGGVRPHVYGDCQHPNGLYIFAGDYVSQSNISDEVRKRIHANHSYSEREILSVRYDSYEYYSD